MGKLIIHGLTKEEAINLCDDYFGSMRWSEEEDGVVRAYPHKSEEPCEFIEQSYQCEKVREK